MKAREFEANVTKDPPPVSVVIPVRDEPGELPAALASVLAQDYEGVIEIVVADGSASSETADSIRARDREGAIETVMADGSAIAGAMDAIRSRDRGGATGFDMVDGPDPPGAAHALRSERPEVRIVPNPDGSTPAGLNRAIAAASHGILVRCDARSRLPPGYVRTAVETLERTGAQAVGGMQRPAGTTAFTRAVAMAMTTPLGAGGARYRIGGPEGPVDTVWLGVFRRGALEAAGGFDGTLERNQDYELNWRIRQAGGTVWFTPALHAEYRPRAGFGALARQYRDWGRWKCVVLRRHPASVRWRHLAAPLLVLALVACAAAGVATASPLALAPPLAWLLALAAGAGVIGLRRRDAAALLLAPVLGTMHLAWGAGFWGSLLGGRAGDRVRSRPRGNPADQPVPEGRGRETAAPARRSQMPSASGSPVDSTAARQSR